MAELWSSAPPSTGLGSISQAPSTGLLPIQGLMPYSVAPKPTGPRAARKPIEKKPIEKWIEYENFIKAQLDKKPPESIHNLFCPRENLTKRGAVTFKNSAFNAFSINLKEFIFDAKNTGVFSDLINTPDPYFLKNNPSFLNVFEDTDACIFYTSFFFAHISKMLQPNLKTNLLEAKNLFTGSYDETFRVDPSQILSVEKKKDILQDIIEKSRSGKSVCVLVQCMGQRMNHTVASVFWQDKGLFYCGVFDPMYYWATESKVINGKKNTVVNSSYIWAVNAFYSTVKAVLNLLDPTKTINIQNWSEYCYLKEGKGKRCLQYVINAEYCMAFSTYFIYLYAKYGCPKDEASIQRVVQESYIVSPEKLIRSPCTERTVFLVRMMSFLLTVLTFMLRKKQSYYQGSYKKIFDAYEVTKAKYGYTILHPDVLDVVKSELDMPKNTMGGGKRRRTRRGKKSR